MRVTRTLVAIAISALPALASAQKPGKGRNPGQSTSLQALAKVSEVTARETALKRVPKGTVQTTELEREKGTIVYTFDIKVPGATGIEEVLVDAISGKVISQEHETPKMEKREARKEAKEKARLGKK